MLAQLKKIKPSRKITALVLAVYLGVVAGATLYSQTGYIQSLPVAYVTRPGRHAIPFTLKETAVVEEGKVHYLTTTADGRHLPNDVIIPGLHVDILDRLTGERGQGEVLSIAGRETVGGAEVWISIDQGDFPAGNQVVITVEGVGREHDNTLPRQAIQEGADGPVIYTVEAEEGPWGERYRLKERRCAYVWPYNDDTTPYVLVNTTALDGEGPIVAATDVGYMYDGMEVQLMPWDGQIKEE